MKRTCEWNGKRYRDCPCGSGDDIGGMCFPCDLHNTVACTSGDPQYKCWDDDGDFCWVEDDGRPDREIYGVPGFIDDVEG